MKKFILFPVLGAVLLVLVLVKIFANTQKEKAILTRPAQPALLAECTIAEKIPGEFSFPAVGKTRANERVELVSELSRRLVSIHFREGTRVNRGDLLFHLDDAEWKAEWLKVKAKLDLARETEERNRRLLESGGISRHVYDELVSQRKILEAEEQYLEVLIEKANIRAPFSGSTGIRRVSEGAFLTPGMVLTVLEDLSRLKLEFTVPESFATAIRKGDRISFRCDGIPDSQAAVIEAFDPSIHSGTGNFHVLAIVENPHPALKAGVSVSLTIPGDSPAPAIYLPTQALIPSAGGYNVFTLVQGKAALHKVTTGLRSEKTVEITEGIQPGDTVLLTGFMRIRQGSPVKIIKVW